MENKPGPPSERRFFLSLLFGIGAVLSAAAIWPIWRFLSPLEGTAEQARVSVPQASVEVGGAHFFNFRGRPAVILQRAAGEFVAFSAVCTHLGCIIQWLPEKNELLCPCHAGRFGTDGRVLGGPPPRPLEVLPVTVSGDQILVG
jgi:cytochrome b6-f complex iron-sulfur subunit